MKKLRILPFLFIVFLFNNVYAQLDIDAFKSFQLENKDISRQELNALYSRPESQYYKGYNLTPELDDVYYLDSVIQKLSLTNDELDLLKTNHFMITERLQHKTLEQAHKDIFTKDLPVFISTDAILHALHCSYDYILKTCEQQFMADNIEQYLKSLYDAVPAFVEQHNDERIATHLGDVDLYVTVAYSLIMDTKLELRYGDREIYDSVMHAIDELSLVRLRLFTNEGKTKLTDFSQFKVRGHYQYTEWDQMTGAKNLEPYFRTMMWLGRMEMWLTAPEYDPWEPDWAMKDIQYTNIAAFLLNELMNVSDDKNLFLENETVINYLVGASDNVTPEMYSDFLEEEAVNDATQLIDSTYFVEYYKEMVARTEFKQKISGGLIYADPYSDLPTILPVSFRVAGQRFIIDSEIFTNVTYKNIIHNGEIMYRMMPDPLDALYALGNSDAEYFLQDEIEKYNYAEELATMRYLVDAKDDEFWDGCLYNAWLESIRKLNPVTDNDNLPFFARTSAWHQQKMNTQLASWAQLRHDNLLYAKPSYTDIAGCSYPRSYVEPYPYFYNALATYSEKAATFFMSYKGKSYELEQVPQFFSNFKSIMDRLEAIANKELKNEQFTQEEEDWLKSMETLDGMCGVVSNGWFVDLFFNEMDYIAPDYINVDIHTQPSDELGNIVGKVLHAGLGNFNIGVFIIKDTYDNGYTAYVGPFMSYYEKITDNFKRLNDSEWEAIVDKDNLPERPEWTNAYLANINGEKSNGSEELPSTMLLGVVEPQLNNQSINIYPNPTSGNLYVDINVEIRNASASVYDFTGKLIAATPLKIYNNQAQLNFENYKEGIYLLKISTSKGSVTEKMVVKH